jgi:hypothetical protein
MALATSDSTESAFRRASDLLSAEGGLSVPQLEELDILLSEVSGTQFMALTSAPENARNFRQYSRHIRLRVFPSVGFLAATLALSVVAGAMLVAG